MIEAYPTKARISHSGPFLDHSPVFFSLKDQGKYFVKQRNTLPQPHSCRALRAERRIWATNLSCTPASIIKERLLELKVYLQLTSPICKITFKNMIVMVYSRWELRWDGNGNLVCTWSASDSKTSPYYSLFYVLQSWLHKRAEIELIQFLDTHKLYRVS